MSDQQAEYKTNWIYPEWKKFSPEIWNKTLGRCWYCGTETQPFNREKFTSQEEGDYRARVRIPPDTFVMDHVIPISLGGTSDIKNLAPCCWSCNGAKKSKSLEEFRFMRSRQLAGMPRFNEDQIAYLCAHDIKLPEITMYIFYFEAIGLSEGEL